MGNLKFGTNDPAALYFGLSGSTKAYFGTTVVYEEGPSPIDYSKEFLTFDILSGGTLIWKAMNDEAVAKTISYSFDSGETWTNITSTLEGAEISVSAGDKVMFKGDTRGTSSGVTDASNYNTFKGTAYFNLSGNIDSLGDSVNFRSGVTLTNTYKALFRDTKVIDASNLYLPSPSVEFQYRFLFKDCNSLIAIPSMIHFDISEQYCCMGMFGGCKALEKATNLPLVTSESSNYGLSEMFSGCTHLNLVENLSTTHKAITFNNWLAGVSATGTFIKNPDTVWGRNANGIPSGWDVQDPQHFLIIGPSSFNLGSLAATSLTVTVSASTSYSLSTNQNWITFPVASGEAGETTFVIQVAEDTSATDRQGSVLFTNGEGLGKTLYINQGYSYAYLTFDILTDGTIGFSNARGGNDLTIDYSLNDGAWTSLLASTGSQAINVQTGDKIRFRGLNTAYGTAATAWTTFDGTAEFNAYGNILSMRYGDDFANYSANTTTRAFAGLFCNTNIISAENLMMPAKIGSNGCLSMFNACRLLEIAPVLPMQTVTSACYRGLFNRCSSLRYIKCLATDISASNCTNGWVTGVSGLGTFVKAASMQDWTEGNSGIPSGWTVEDAS